MDKTGNKVAIVMGSISDEPIMKNASDILKEFGATKSKETKSEKKESPEERRRKQMLGY